MLVKHAPDRYEKLQHLGGMATDDILAPSSSDERMGAAAGWNAVGPRGGRTPTAGVYRAAMPNGKRISLLRVMFTDHCIMDCHYCPNSHWVPRRRFGFKVDELASLFDEMQRRGTVAGLFLSSGIFKDPDVTQSRLLDVVEAVRKRGFEGYIHLKVMPGTKDEGLIEAARRLGTRLSVNMEAPTAEHMAKLSRMKQFEEGIVEPMRRIREGMLAAYGGAVGQATQLVVGAADETDADIFTRMRQLYGEMGLKRVYYSAFRPIQYTPLEEHPATPKAREHRLYQMDWLSRFYGFEEDDLRMAFDGAGFLDMRADPKLIIAGQQIERFPIDVNHADERTLLRTPGIGPLAASRIVQHRREHRVNHWRDLQAMGVVWKRARHFVRFPGHKPEPAAQGALSLFSGAGEGRAPARSVRREDAASLHERYAPKGCAGCPLSGPAATCGGGYSAPGAQAA